MLYLYSIHSVAEDRDLSRAAAERSLIVQALSERQAAAQISHANRILTRLLHMRMLRHAAPRPTVAPGPAAASMVK